MSRYLKLVSKLYSNNKYRERYQDSNICLYNAEKRKDTYAARKQEEYADNKEN